MKAPPKWSVHANLVSKSTPWVGESWEFFDEEIEAAKCYDTHVARGNCPTKRPFHKTDIAHMHCLDKLLIETQEDSDKCQFCSDGMKPGELGVPGFVRCGDCNGTGKAKGSQ